MWKWLTGRGQQETAKAGTLGLEGGSPVVEEKVRSVRLKLTNVRTSINVIVESGYDTDRQIEHNGDSACTQIEGVLQNLRRDPDDITRMGLALDALSPVEELLRGCAQACQLHSKELLKEAIPLSANALRETTARFKALREGAVALNDSLEIAGLARTVSRLFRN